MPTFRDRAGEIYGRLTVVAHNGKDKRGKHLWLWLCICTCGKSKVVVSDNLSSGKSNSCGCLKMEVLKRPGNQYGVYLDRQDAMLKVQYSHLKRRNRKFGFEVITYEKFRSLAKSPCKYCGLEFSKETHDRACETKSKKLISNEVLKSNGVDRINCLIGYTEENSVPCCKRCNFAKHTMTEAEFIHWIQSVYEYFAIASKRIS